MASNIWRSKQITILRTTTKSYAVGCNPWTPPPPPPFLFRPLSVVFTSVIYERCRTNLGTAECRRRLLAREQRALGGSVDLRWQQRPMGSNGRKPVGPEHWRALWEGPAEQGLLHDGPVLPAARQTDLLLLSEERRLHNLHPVRVHSQARRKLMARRGLVQVVFVAYHFTWGNARGMRNLWLFLIAIRGVATRWNVFVIRLITVIGLSGIRFGL